jgi:AcrR family transcriptional regulator
VAHRKRGGRPSADQAGEVDRRILDAATALFLRSGYDATSCDQVVALAGAGKASLYARYANKDALFDAVVRRVVEQATPLEVELRWDAPLRERLQTVILAWLNHVLAAEAVALMRTCLTTAHRLPELSRMVDRMGRDEGVASVIRALTGPAPSLGNTEAAKAIAQRLIDMVILPQQMRALVGDDSEQLGAEGHH